ncbi:Extradiol ring-cleavage dioxygenase, class III enzyme, subunit B [Amanita muscaria]
MALPKTQADWRKALDDLPGSPNNIPAVFFAHGSPLLAYPSQVGGSDNNHGPTGLLASFLKDFGPALLQKYKPKGIVVFSAHWETHGQRLVTDYGDENPLLMDYYGFPPELYQLKFKSRSDSALAHRVVEVLTKAGQRARTIPKTEPRGEDGRGFEGPGLDHGVFVPFRIMFGTEFTEIPIVQVSIDGSLTPEENWALGKAVAPLREEGILILSGGLGIHNLRDRGAFAASTARPIYHEFDKAVHEAVAISDGADRKKALAELTKHAGFRAAHPREEHLIPIYVAGGAGEEGGVHVLMREYGLPTVAFGV